MFAGTLLCLNSLLRKTCHPLAVNCTNSSSGNISILWKQSSWNYIFRIALAGSCWFYDKTGIVHVVFYYGALLNAWKYYSSRGEGTQAVWFTQTMGFSSCDPGNKTFVFYSAVTWVKQEKSKRSVCTFWKELLWMHFGSKLTWIDSRLQKAPLAAPCTWTQLPLHAL